MATSDLLGELGKDGFRWGAHTWTSHRPTHGKTHSRIPQMHGSLGPKPQGMLTTWTSTSHPLILSHPLNRNLNLPNLKGGPRP